MSAYPTKVINAHRIEIKALHEWYITLWGFSHKGTKANILVRALIRGEKKMEMPT
jgi:hypothetical protein